MSVLLSVNIFSCCTTPASAQPLYPCTENRSHLLTSGSCLALERLHRAFIPGRKSISSSYWYLSFPATVCHDGNLDKCSRHLLVNRDQLKSMASLPLLVQGNHLVCQSKVRECNTSHWTICSCLLSECCSHLLSLS